MMNKIIDTNIQLDDEMVTVTIRTNGDEIIDLYNIVDNDLLVGTDIEDNQIKLLMDYSGWSIDDIDVSVNAEMAKIRSYFQLDSKTAVITP